MGKPLAPNGDQAADRELRNMQDVVFFNGNYISISQKSIHMRRW